jgi:hypothetical protein
MHSDRINRNARGLCVALLCNNCFRCSLPKSNCLRPVGGFELEQPYDSSTAKSNCSYDIRHDLTVNAV